MRGVSAWVLGALLLRRGAGCGSADEQVGAPPAAGDAGVQRAASDAGSGAASASRAAGGDVLRGTYTRLNGERDDLARYRGDMVLVVNTATECGYTPQLEVSRGCIAGTARTGSSCSAPRRTTSPAKSRDRTTGSRNSAR